MSTPTPSFSQGDQLSLLLHLGRLTRLPPSIEEPFYGDMSVINETNLLTNCYNQLIQVMKVPPFIYLIIFIIIYEMETTWLPPTTFDDQFNFSSHQRGSLELMM